jgi:hypothetical protein
MLADGAKQEQILADFPDLEAEDIQACIAYAARYLDAGVMDGLSGLGKKMVRDTGFEPVTPTVSR